MPSARSNQAFLRNIYEKGEFEGHGFVCNPTFESTLIDDLDYSVSPRPLEEFLPAIVRNYELQTRFLEETGGHAVPYGDLMTGTHLYAGAFGCPIEKSPGTNPFAGPLVGDGAQADALAVPSVEGARATARVIEMGHLLERALGKDVPLGPPDMQTGFDTASLIWEKASFMTALLTEPESVHRLAEKAARFLASFLQVFRREFPQASPCHCPHVWAPPEMGPWVSNDECGTMSVEMFEEFCLPEMIELSQTFGGMGMHCCAQAEHQFPSFRKIPGFYAFNRVAASQGFQPILEHLGSPEGPVHVLCWIPDEEIARLIEAAPEGTRFIFVLAQADADRAKEWLEKLGAL